MVATVEFRVAGAETTRIVSCLQHFLLHVLDGAYYLTMLSGCYTTFTDVIAYLMS